MGDDRGGLFDTQDLIGVFDPSLGPGLFDRSILIVGLGGNGTHLAVAAARLGFTTIIGVDMDVVSPSNLTRQVLYTNADVGRPKANVAAGALDSHNLRSVVEMVELDILTDRARFTGLVRRADLVFIVLDQPAPAFFAVSACHALGKPAISGGTCTLTGLATEVRWMDSGGPPCLNCTHHYPAVTRPWTDYYGSLHTPPGPVPAAVHQLDATIRLDGGHPSMYPTAAIGSNLMMATGLAWLSGRRDMPTTLHFSLLPITLEPSDRPARPDCPTCAPKSRPHQSVKLA